MFVPYICAADTQPLASCLLQKPSRVVSLGILEHAPFRARREFTAPREVLLLAKATVRDDFRKILDQLEILYLAGNV